MAGEEVQEGKGREWKDKSNHKASQNKLCIQRRNIFAARLQIQEIQSNIIIHWQQCSESAFVLEIATVSMALEENPGF